MRVIGGTARGVPLRAPSGPETRPISDRSKEALFNILAPDIPGCAFLDLFAGTGGVGIEALSRGAQSATFVELSKRIFDDLLWNLEKTRLRTKADVKNIDAFEFLQGTENVFDVIFIAPPQWRGMWVSALDRLCANSNMISADGVVITQHDPRENQPFESKMLKEYRRKTYGGVQFGFYSASIG